jgi:FixJ family two-component response regulator
MIIDENQDFVDMAKVVLHKAGYSADCYNNFRDAILTFRPYTFAIILLGIRMKKISAFDLARELWRQQSDANIYFMASFEIHPHEAKKVFKSLRDPRFIQRPTTPKALLSAMKQLKDQQLADEQASMV